MAYAVSFGMGCFHFGVKGRLPFRFIGSQYIDEVRRVLHSIPSVDQVAIEADKEFEGYCLDVVEDLPRIGDGTGSFPRAVLLGLGFEIYLPWRVQEELVAKKRWAQPAAERYRVFIKYGYEMPVAFVEPLTEEPSLSPSDGALIVAEFLRSAVPEGSSERVFFDCLEPTPFPAHCYLGPGAEEGNSTHGWRFRLERHALPGHDALLFEFNVDRFDTAETARDALYHDLKEEVSLFYSVHCHAKSNLLAWHELTHGLDELIALQQMEGPKGFLKRLVSTPRDAGDLALQAARSEADVIIADTTVRNSRALIYAGGFPTYLESYVARAIQEAPQYPYEQLNRSVNLIHGARSKSVDNIVLLGAAVLSGAAGALLIRWLSG